MFWGNGAIYLRWPETTQVGGAGVVAYRETDRVGSHRPEEKRVFLLVQYIMTGLHNTNVIQT